MQDRTWPVRSLKPNDFGLFDVYGNVSEWCQDEPRPYTAREVRRRRSARACGLLIDAEELRAHRGGGFEYVPAMVTSAGRDRSDPDYSLLQPRLPRRPDDAAPRRRRAPDAVPAEN